MGRLDNISVYLEIFDKWKKNIYLRFWSLIPKPSNETGSPNPSEVGFTAVGFAPMASWLGMLHPHIRKHMAL